jgi:chemotaxis protein MotA
MDLSTVIGLGGGFLLILIAILSKGPLSTFWDTSSFLIVFGGTVAAFMISYPLDKIKNLMRILRKAFFEERYDVGRAIEQICELAYVSRRDGLLAMERLVDGLDNLYLKKGVLLLVDGNDPAMTERIMELEIENMVDRHAEGEGMLKTLGKYSPALGMIGTLIGLILMLKNLEDTSTLGSSMGVAMITTFYGSLLANMVFLPLAGKLKFKSDREAAFKYLILEGIMAIQAGESPLMIEEKLKTYVEENMRVKKDLESAENVQVDLNEA